MKKLVVGLLSLGLFTTPVLAEIESQTAPEAPQTKKSRFYVGVDLFQGDSEFELTSTGDLVGKLEKEFDQDGLRVKLGAELEDNWRVQGYFKREDTDAFDNDIYGIGVDVIKSFQVTNRFYPFIQAGVSFDWVELEKSPYAYYTEDSLNATALKLGIGARFDVTDSVELMAGYDWQYRKWQDIEVYQYPFIYTIEQEDTSKTLYLGFNVNF